MSTWTRTLYDVNEPRRYQQWFEGEKVIEQAGRHLPCPDQLHSRGVVAFRAPTHSLRPKITNSNRKTYGIAQQRNCPLCIRLEVRIYNIDVPLARLWYTLQEVAGSSAEVGLREGCKKFFRCDRLRERMRRELHRANGLGVVRTVSDNVDLCIDIISILY